MKQMKTTMLTLLVLFLGPVVLAQTVEDQIALSRAQIQAERQQIVAETLGLSDNEAKAFWPLYRAYRAEMDKPIDRAWAVLTTYGDQWESMSDADAAKALDEWLSIENESVQIKQKWAKKMAKEINGATAARFFQIDNKLDTIIKLEAALEIPLIRKK
jgi:hypothetical protein